MKHIVSIISVLLLSLSLSWGDDFQKAYDADQRGDYAVAFEGFKKLAEQGEPASQYNLGLMFYKGNGTVQDFSAALKCFTFAANQGRADAQYMVGVMYRSGNGVLVDYKNAVKWYKLAGEQVNTEAHYELARSYAGGLGLTEDYVYAHMWANIASANGHKKARKFRKLLADLMSPSQIQKAKDLARECVKKNYKGC